MEKDKIKEKFFKKLSTSNNISLYILNNNKEVIWKSGNDEFPLEELPIHTGTYCYRLLKGEERKNTHILKIETQSSKRVKIDNLNERVYAITVIPLEDGKMGILKQDITFFKRFQENQFYRYNLEVITNLASGIAHEINNPLTVIQGLVEFNLQKKSGIPLEDAKQILKMCKRIKSSISHFIGYFDSNFFKKEEVEIREVIRESIDIYLNYSKCKDIKITFMENSSHKINIEKNLIINSILNIINNLSEILKDFENKEIKIRLNSDKKRTKISFHVKISSKDTEKMDKFLFPYFNFNCKTENMGCGFLIAYWGMKKIGGELSLLREKDSFSIDIIIPEKEENFYGQKED